MVLAYEERLAAAIGAGSPVVSARLTTLCDLDATLLGRKNFVKTVNAAGGWGGVGAIDFDYDLQPFWRVTCSVPSSKLASLEDDALSSLTKIARKTGWEIVSARSLSKAQLPDALRDLVPLWGANKERAIWEHHPRSTYVPKEKTEPVTRTPRLFAAFGDLLGDGKRKKGEGRELSPALAAALDALRGGPLETSTATRHGKIASSAATAAIRRGLAKREGSLVALTDEGRGVLDADPCGGGAGAKARAGVPSSRQTVREAMRRMTKRQTHWCGECESGRPEHMDA
jgi:hypothetical protein